MINVVFDYGHGNTPASQRGFIGGHEGENNFKFGRMVKAELERFDGVVIHETRPNIENDPHWYKERPSMFNYVNPDLYISWHSNAYDGVVRGVEAIYRPDNPNLSNVLLTRMANLTSSVLGIPNRGLKGYYMAVLGNGNKAKVKMMLEMFFHDNIHDVRAYWRKQADLARAYAVEIANYYNLKPKQLNKTTTTPVENVKDKEQTVFTWDKDHKLARYTFNGVDMVGFHKLGDYMYYFRPENGYLVYGGFYKIGDYWYYFRRKTGTMATGWQFIDDDWYWFRESGTMVTGVQFIDGKWHYFDSQGVYQYTFTEKERIK